MAVRGKGKVAKQGKSGAKRTAPAADVGKRAYISQADIPSYSLEQALRIPRAIAEHFGYKPASPLSIAAALNVLPTSSLFRQLTGASIAYGLTKGGYNASEITIEPLGLRIVRPLQEGDDLAAKREALLKPKIVGEFLQRYNGASLPREDIGNNVLQGMGVPIERAAAVQEMIVQGADLVGVLRSIKEKRYVDLSGVAVSEVQAEGTFQELPEPFEEPLVESKVTVGKVANKVGDSAARRVFITHGKNRAFIDPIKKLLGFGEMEPVVSVEKTSVSQPVPDKVMSEMRGCGSAIIHVDAEQKLIDKDANEQAMLNPNVLIEIGAAMALYGRRFILLVKDGVKLPSNLQGLFEVRYTGDALDGEATIKLLEAINDIKNHPVPNRYSESAVE